MVVWFSSLRRGILLTVAGGLVALSGAVAAQEKFPSKPIEVVIHSKYGGGTDVTARMMMIRTRRGLDVDMAVVCGDRRKYLVALVTLNLEAVRDFAHVEGIAFDDDNELYDHPEIHALIERVIAQKNERFARFEAIKRFAVIPGTLTTADGGLTPTLKVKRKHVREKYAEVIDSLYRD